ncbi:capsid protein [Peach-associated virus 2]|nr:capsid protein [Peach-associated virus 2]
MDSFVKRFFPHHDAPGADFQAEGDLQFSTYFGGILKVFDGHVTTNRNYFSVQKMTAAGKMRATIMGSSSSLDGITKQYLTPEGMINISTLSEALKQSSGLQTQMFTAHVNKMQHWGWADNHVALLMNLLRLCMILKIQEENAGTLNVSNGVYADGHVSVDMDQWWDDSYPEKAKMDTWPSGQGDDEDDYPDFMHLTTTTPDVEANAVDLRGLTTVEATIVLMMFGRWRRRSRCRLDYDTPRLANTIMYRHSSKMTSLEAWLKEEAGAEAPKMVNSAQVWAALRAYVGQNRLYDQFSAALYSVSFMTYQFLPSTAEACIWLSFDWNMVIPSFSSIRGRYELLNDGEAALVSHRAINEWGYINGKLEKVNLMCMLVAQCFQTGCAVRSTRRGLEINPNDLYSTEAEFYSAANFTSAAVSEAIRSEFPMPGMAGIYMRTDVRFDDAQDMEVLTLNSTDDGLDGYDTKMVEIKKKRIVKVKQRLAELEGMPEYGELTEVIAMFKDMAALKRKHGRRVKLSPEEVAAENDEILVDGEEIAAEEQVAVKVVWVPIAGAPVLAMPLNPFPYNTPLTLKGMVEPSMGALTRKGFKLTADKCWTVANVARLCGYDISFRQGSEPAGPTEFFSPNDVNMVWPVLSPPDEQDEEMVIVNTEQRDNMFIALPPLHNKFFSNQKIEYSVQINRKGVSIGFNHERRDIAEFGGAAKISKEVSVIYNTSETVQRMRGYITREESGFRYVGGVTGGVIPPPNVEQAAQAAAGD